MDFDKFSNQFYALAYVNREFRISLASILKKCKKEDQKVDELIEKLLDTSPTSPYMPLSFRKEIVDILSKNVDMVHELETLHFEILSSLYSPKSQKIPYDVQIISKEMKNNFLSCRILFQQKRKRILFLVDDNDIELAKKYINDYDKKAEGYDYVVRKHPKNIQL
jgi:vacuolar-type H+-ATPase subunit I/STV1